MRVVFAVVCILCVTEKLLFANAASACAEPEAPENGEVVISRRSNTFKAVFSCNDGFKIVGAKMLRCKINGKLSSDPPKCMRMQTCPDGSAPANCILNPCDYETCKFDAFITTCEPDYCGGACRAKFYANMYGQKQDVTFMCDKIYECPAHDAPTFSNTNDGREFCLNHDDCRGTSFCCKTDDGSNKCAGPYRPSGPTYGICPGESSPSYCPRGGDPCDSTITCAVAGASCVMNYCAQCKAEWFKDGVKLSEGECSGSCPGGIAPANCMLNPCDYATCEFDAFTTTCEPDYCGGACRAKFYANMYGQKRDVTFMCDKIYKCPAHDSPKISNTNDGREFCLNHDDCRGTSFCCKTDDGSNKCAGPYGPSGPTYGICPGESSRSECPRGSDPCDSTTCAVAGASCVMNHCAQCKAEWFKDGVKLTAEDCNN